MEEKKLLSRQATPCLIQWEVNVAKVLTHLAGAASGVPGTMHAMMSALERYGTFHPKLLLLPALQRARDGWLLGKRCFTAF